jgi:hypothetical protein
MKIAAAASTGFGDVDVLVARHLRLAPQRDLGRRRRSRPEERLLLGFELLARRAVGATVPAKALIVPTPVPRVRVRVLERRKDLRQTVVTDGFHGALHAPFITRMTDPCGIDVTPARPRIRESVS